MCESRSSHSDLSLPGRMRKPISVSAKLESSGFGWFNMRNTNSVKEHSLHKDQIIQDISQLTFKCTYYVKETRSFKAKQIICDG